MADITLTYKGATIAEISATGTKTIETAGKYCEADIGLAYVKPGGSADSITIWAGLNPASSNLKLPPSIKNASIVRDNKGTAYKGGRLASTVLYLFSDAGSETETITIDYGIVQPTNATDTFRSDDTLASLSTIHFLVDTSEVTGWDRFMYYRKTNLHNVVVDGTPIDFSKMAQWSDTLNFDGLKEIRFVPDKINVSTVTIGNTYTEEYSDDTWASLANALKAGTAGSFAIGATAQATISAIMGVNNSGLFELSASGTLSLADFITTVKGWTLA